MNKDNVDVILETGVDRLVSLIKIKGRISIYDAAKEISIPEDLVQEWAEFLEKEGIIAIEYKLATPYLIDKKLSDKELMHKATEFGSKKEALVRRGEAILFSLDKQSDRFKEIKDEFSKMQSELGHDMKSIKDELDEFSKYDKFKRDIDNEMLKQQQEFKRHLNDMNKEVEKEQKKYDDILKGIEAEQHILEEEEKRTDSIVEAEKKLKNKLDEINKVISEYDKVVKDKNKTIDESKERIEKLRAYANQVKNEIEHKRQKIIKPLEDKSKDYEERISDLQKRVLKKVLERRKNIDQNMRSAEETASRFEKFFDRKNELGQLLIKIEKDKIKLEKEIRDMVAKAKATSIISKKTKLKVDAKQLEKMMKHIEERKSILMREFERLSELLRG